MTCRASCAIPARLRACSISVPGPAVSRSLPPGDFPKPPLTPSNFPRKRWPLRRKNVADHGLKKRIRLLRGDLFAPVKGARYDLIVANPPYVDAAGMKNLPPECRHEPRLAFAGGADGLTLVRRILDAAGDHLTDVGGLLCEVGRGRKRLERAYPDLGFLWLDTEASTGEVFWLDASLLRG